MSIAQIEETLHSLLDVQDPVYEMARYSLEGGKRLRPLLTLAVLDAFEIPLDRGLIPACAIELVHTYSLIHDDLPCMDNDDMRRGKPSLHRKYPESHAVLTGDFLLTFAFECISNAPLLDDKTKVQLMASLANRSGAEGMIGGQILDIRHQEYALDLDLLEEMQFKKTGALITCALEFGSILGAGSLNLLQSIGKKLGLAFQIVDDLLDQDGSSMLYGVEGARNLADRLYSEALSEIQSLPGRTDTLESLAEEMVYRRV